jgi:hypothetical protein
VLLEPGLQQVPGGGVAVDPTKHRRLLGDTGDLAEQRYVHAEPATTVHGTRGAAFGYGYVEAQAGQGDRRRQAD